MLDILLNPTTGIAKAVFPLVIRAGRTVPVRITLDADPGDAITFELSLGEQKTNPTPLAFLDVFQAESPTVYLGEWDTNDTRLLEYMATLAGATLDLEILYTLGGEPEACPNLAVAIQKRIKNGPASGTGGPNYLTDTQSDARYATQAALGAGLENRVRDFMLTPWDEIEDGGHYVFLGDDAYAQVVYSAKSNVTVYNGGTGYLTIADVSQNYEIQILPGESVAFDANPDGPGVFELAEIQRYTGSSQQFVNNLFNSNRTFNGTNNTAPNQPGVTPGISTLLVKAQADLLYPNAVRTSLPTPSYSSNGNLNRSYLIEYWNIPGSTTTGLSNSQNVIYLRAMAVAGANGHSLQLAPAPAAVGANLVATISDLSAWNGSFKVSTGSGIIDFITKPSSSALLLPCSGVASKFFRYKFSANFTAAAGAVVVMSPSGHTFVVEEAITDATVWTSAAVGGVAVRQINGGGAPTTSDTSLTVNSGGAITTTYVSNSATNSGVYPESLFFYNSTGIYLYTKTFGLNAGLFELQYHR